MRCRGHVCGAGAGGGGGGGGGGPTRTWVRGGNSCCGSDCGTVSTLSRAVLAFPSSVASSWCDRAVCHAAPAAAAVPGAARSRSQQRLARHAGRRLHDRLHVRFRCTGGRHDAPAAPAVPATPAVPAVPAVPAAGAAGAAAAGPASAGGRPQQQPGRCGAAADVSGLRPRAVLAAAVRLHGTRGPRPQAAAATGQRGRRGGG